MSVSKHVQNYLTAKDIPFEIVHHKISEDPIQTASYAKVPLMSIAKAVILEDHQGHHLMAVVPGSDRVKLHKLGKLTDSELNLAPEEKLRELFKDCEIGAIPALGPAFHMDTWYASCLLNQDKIYIESGDHQCLLELSKADFERAMETCHRDDFSELAGGEIQL